MSYRIIIGETSQTFEDIGDAAGFVMGLAMLVFFEAVWKAIDIIDRQRKERRK